MATDVVEGKVVEETVVPDKCPMCDFEPKNQHGLDIHIARKHKSKAKTKAKSTPKAKTSKAKPAAKPAKVATTGNGKSIVGASIKENSLTVETESGATIAFSFGRPSLVLDLLESARTASREYVDHLGRVLDQD